MTIPLIQVAFLILLVAFFILMLISVIFGLLSINVTNNPKDHIALNNKNIDSLWFLQTIQVQDENTKKARKIIEKSLDKYVGEVAKLNHNDIIEIISLELLKISYIRDIKLTRTNLCIKYLIYSLISLGLIFSYLVLYYLASY